MRDIKDKRLCFTRIAEGDKEAFDTFFKHYHPKLIQFACIFIKSEQQAEDVVAEVLTTLLIQRKRVFSLEHFEAYLYSSVKNKALSFIKKQERVNNYSQDPQSHKLSTVSSDPYDLMVEKEMSALVNEVIHNFPPRRQMVFQLIREEGFSYRKVGELMNISERTVEVHLKLAIQALRLRIEQYLSEETPGK